MKKLDVAIISSLRQNGRLRLTQLSKKIKEPVSTLHERLNINIRQEIVKPTVLLDFDKIGFRSRAFILLAAEEKDKLVEYLGKHPNVNMLAKINNGWSLIMEGVFRDMQALEDFVDNLESRFHIKQKQVHYVIAELKRESFVSKPDVADLILCPSGK